MPYNTTHANQAENLPPVTLDHLPGETLRAFLAFFQLGPVAPFGGVEDLRYLMPTEATGLRL
jgi:hypothetical protein